jgi:hypothetical protein
MMGVELDVMGCLSSMNLDDDWILNSTCVRRSEAYFLDGRTHKRKEVVQLPGLTAETDVMAGWN